MLPGTVRLTIKLGFRTFRPVCTAIPITRETP